MKLVSRKGFTLIEIVVASIILAMVVVTCATLLISTFSSFPKEKSKYLASQEANSLKEELKNYVTDDLSITANAPGNPPWHLPDDASCSDCWALAEGNHEVTARLPAEVRATYGATMSYSVTIVQYQGREMRNVSINVNWTAP